MSFNFGTPKTDAASNLTFGSPAAGGDARTAPKFGVATTQAGFGGFGGAKTTTNTPSFALGATPSVAPNTGLAFGTPPQTGNLTFAATPQSQNTSFNLSAAVAATPSFNLSAAATTPTASPAPGGCSFGAATPKLGGGLNLGAATTTTASTLTTSFSLGGIATTTTTTATPLNFSTPSSAAGVQPAAISGTFSLGSALAATSTAAAAAPPLTTTTAAAAPPLLGFGAASAAKTTGGLAFGASTAITSASGFALNTSTALSAPTTASSALPVSGNLTFGQLEDAINKWTIDLDEQGKLFANQAKQLNAWDRLLISNGEKILCLNNGIERVKQQQHQLDQELDFVLAQQKELEDLIVPLERDLTEMPATDGDRAQTYQIAENIDTQLKQMSEDLKEVIEQLNESNKSQEMTNPITQIGRILNAHMNSLQWVDRNTTKINAHIDQISKMHDFNRKNHEKNLQRTYDS